MTLLNRSSLSSSSNSNAFSLGSKFDFRLEAPENKSSSSSSSSSPKSPGLMFLISGFGGGFSTFVGTVLVLATGGINSSNRPGLLSTFLAMLASFLTSFSGGFWFLATLPNFATSSFVKAFET